MRNTYKTLVREPEGKGKLKRQRRLDDNIKIILK